MHGIPFDGGALVASLAFKGLIIIGAAYAIQFVIAIACSVCSWGRIAEGRDDV